MAFRQFRLKGGDRKVKRHIQSLCEQIVRAARPQKIILFGSYAYGQPTVDSDIGWNPSPTGGRPFHFIVFSNKIKSKIL